MNKGIVKKISILVAAIALSGCSNMATQHAAGGNARPILSAAEAQAEIHVTVRILEPAPEIATFAALAE